MSQNLDKIKREKSHQYYCPMDACQTRILLEETLLELVLHDIAADNRDDVPFSFELQKACDVLEGHCGYIRYKGAFVVEEMMGVSDE
ncbi:unnamed protein product [marine sediment metagenome]|uniref:Uncharacterized protein n=1 Tax=marine sediment metagenome TaxID=412755 RepID=X1FAD9_9ZZZZ